MGMGWCGSKGRIDVHIVGNLKAAGFRLISLYNC